MKSTAMLLSLMISFTSAHSPPTQDVSPSCDGESAPPFHSYHIHVLFYPDTEFEKANMGEFGGGVSGATPAHKLLMLAGPKSRAGALKLAARFSQQFNITTTCAGLDHQPGLCAVRRACRDCVELEF